MVEIEMAAAAYPSNSVHEQILKLRSEISQLEEIYESENKQMESWARIEAGAVEKLAIEEEKMAKSRWKFEIHEVNRLKEDLKRVRNGVERNRADLQRIRAAIDSRRQEIERLEARRAPAQEVRNIQPGAANGSASNVKPKRKPPVAVRAPGAASAANEAEPGVLIVRPKRKPPIAPRANAGAGASAARGSQGGKRSNRQSKRQSKRTHRRYRR